MHHAASHFKHVFKHIDKMNLFEVINKMRKQHTYRVGKENRHGHSNDKRSYWVRY